MIDQAMTTRVPPTARADIEELIIEHAWMIDHGQADELSSLYTDNGRMLGLGDDIVGRDAIAAWGLRRAALLGRTSRHVCTNIRLVWEAADRIRGTAVLTVYRHDGADSGPAIALMVGDYEDIFARGADGRWRFAERRLVTRFGG